MARTIIMLSLIFLSQNSFALPCSLIAERPHARLERCGGMKVLVLMGNPVERALANGELIKEGLLAPDTIEYFSTRIDTVLAEKPWIVRKLTSFLYSLLVGEMHSKAPEGFAAELEAMAAGMGRSAKSLQKAISLPDTATMINPLVNRDALPVQGCTSVARRDPASGEFYYGRNLDFGGAGVWDRFPLLLVVLPEPNSGELKHAGFVSEGLHQGGITGFNEAGIAFAVHQNFMKNPGMSGIYGTPLVYVGEAVLRKARTLDEAVEIVRAHTPNRLWTFVISDRNRGETIAIEASRQHFAVRKMENGVLVQTNHVMDPEIKKSELIAESVLRNSLLRMELATEQASVLTRSRLGPSSMAKILAYQKDPEGKLSAYADVMKAHTIQTVVMNRDSFFFGYEDAPTASGKYVTFPRATSVWAGKNYQYEELDLTLTPPRKRAFQKNTAIAFREYMDHKDYLAVAKTLSDQDSLDAYLLRSISLYKAGDYSAALALLAEADTKGAAFAAEPRRILQSLAWVKMLALHRAGETEKSRALAAELAPLAENPRLKDLASALAAGTQPDAQAFKITFEFFSGDLSSRME